MTKATALFISSYPEKNEAFSISLKNGRKFINRRADEGLHIVGTYRQGPLYEWFNLVPIIENGRIRDVIAVDQDGTTSSELQLSWESYADAIIDLLSAFQKNKLEKILENGW